jgi:hypothetical protein
MIIRIYGKPIKTLRQSLKYLGISLLIAFAGVSFIPKTYSVEVPKPLPSELPKAEDIKPTLKETVMEIVDFYGVNRETVEIVVQCESQWQPEKIGDNGHSFGLWQWHLKSHPEITKSCALNPICSTYVAMEHISPQGKYFKEGGWNLWTCYLMHY